MFNSSLSIIVITLNEEKDISSCLESVKTISDDIVVVDSGSTDRTAEIVKKYTSKFFHNDWKGFGPQKQFALEKAEREWVLNIDADERVTPALAQEIKILLDQPNIPHNAFHIPFQHIFMSRHLKFGGNSGEKHLRLFRRDKASYARSLVHEGIFVEGTKGSLKGEIVHYSYRNVEEYLKKCNSYTSLIARQKFGKGEHFSFWHHFRLPFEFVKRYVFRLGFLDGTPGFIYAVLSSYYVWLKFVKLKDLEENRS